MYCRGHELRIELCEQYDIRPVGHFKLLNGRTVVSDAGNMDITDEYIIFECISNTDHHHESIYCGRYVANDLCEITGYSLPQLFDPIHHNTDNHGGETLPPANNNRWNKTRKQLYDIVLLLIVYFGNLEINSPLFNIKKELEDPDYIDHYPKKQIKGVNTIIGNTGKTFQEIVNELNENNDLRVFRYDLVADYMEKLEINQHLFR